MPTVIKHFKRNLNSLAEVFDLLDHFVAEIMADDQAKHALGLAVDELFTNMIKYHPSNQNDISIELQTEGDTIVLQMVDRDVEPFDLTQRPDPDLSGSLHDRQPGGLGIFLLKQLMDDVVYRYDDRTSTITLKKNFRRNNV